MRGGGERRAGARSRGWRGEKRHREEVFGRWRQHFWIDLFLLFVGLAVLSLADPVVYPM